ncbi:MAG: c-type cytochrome [Gemmataceae bacterium]|nr:c-type cytochrome [Gemmataceae bacterium]
MKTSSIIILCATVVACASSLTAQTKSKPKQVIPHAQTKPPGPPLSPQEALKKMQVPPGFHVELVAAEPDIVNPVAMTIDERGRFWITESLEYPKRAAGPGRDRVKVLESTKGDGKFDKITTVIEGLNIPSGIAVGHGGVWVANSPDMLYYPLLDRDTLKLGKPEVVCTGFGRDDTHELPNSLTWGPDGWLYGLNGVFNRSRVKSNNGKTYDFTCALFRIHPRTKEFQVWCEGTSNPWGLAFNDNGDAFVSACVIDHLWHLVETGYYHRQGGPYPPFTWKIESIVKHKHQKAAYCGLTWFDSDAYPPEYREKLYMGNIHGNAINCDMLTKDGSTYQGKPALSAKRQAGLGAGVGEGSNFLLANDVWFMPVVQKTGPDGCLYILDWYDRYHCYQDANRDPKGIDRLRGRLWRVVYKDYKAAGKFDLGKETADQLIDRLKSPNVYFREIAQRILAGYLKDQLRISQDAQQSWKKLNGLLRDVGLPRKVRLQALWALLASDANSIQLHQYLIAHGDAAYRAWQVRTLGSRGRYAAGALDDVIKLAQDPSLDVKLQVAVAIQKLTNDDPFPVLLNVLADSGNDKLIPHIVWQNLHPLLEERGEEFFRLAAKQDMKKSPGLAAVVPRAFDRVLAGKKFDAKNLTAIIDSLSKAPADDVLVQCLATLNQRIQTGELKSRRGMICEAIGEDLRVRLMNKAPSNAAQFEFGMLMASLRESIGLEFARAAFDDWGRPEGERLKALAALTATDDDFVLERVPSLLTSLKGSPQFRGQVIATLGNLDDPDVAKIVLTAYPKIEPELQPRVVDLLTQRAVWSKALLAEIAAKKIPQSALNVNQVRKLLASKDAALVKQVTAVWGTVRIDRNPQREQLVAQMRGMLQSTPGDPKAGRLHFNKICAQCHKMHGEGQEVGPDITANGRNDFEQLLSNVFDPSLVIGAGYTATTVVTQNGQSLAGLLVEDSPQRIVLKTQGGKIETIARDNVDQVLKSKLSYMPEDVEKQLRPREIADLFAYLCLDRPPEDPKARKIPGTPR